MKIPTGHERALMLFLYVETGNASDDENLFDQLLDFQKVLSSLSNTSNVAPSLHILASCSSVLVSFIPNHGPNICSSFTIISRTAICGEDQESQSLRERSSGCKVVVGHKRSAFRATAKR